MTTPTFQATGVQIPAAALPFCRLITNVYPAFCPVCAAVKFLLHFFL
jgi:hypothetical protein